MNMDMDMDELERETFLDWIAAHYTLLFFCTLDEMDCRIDILMSMWLLLCLFCAWF